MLNLNEKGKKLGQLLVERGLITGEQLIRAIQSQRVVGGRIGTCLLEMDVLTEDKLLEALSEQLSVPAARIDKLRAVDHEVLEMLPSKVASRWQAIPFASGEHDVQVATLNVKNLACLDEIQFCTNKRVQPHIANEVRIFEALEKYYSVECPRRYGHLLDRLNRSRYMWDESAKILMGASETEWAVKPETDNGDHVMRSAAGSSTRYREGPLSATSPATELPMTAITWPTSLNSRPVDNSAAATNGGTRPEPETLTLSDVERLLAGQSNQKAIGQVILRYLGQSFSRCAMFVVKNNRIRGWLQHGGGVDPAAFRAVEIRLDQPSAFLALVKGAEFFLGPLAPLLAHQELARCWGGDLPQQCVMLPIRLRGRLISIVYVDHGTRGLQGIDLEEIKQLMDKASIAFELCILRRKLEQRITDS